MIYRTLAILLATTTLAQAFADPPGECGSFPDGKVPLACDQVAQMPTSRWPKMCLMETDFPDRYCRAHTDPKARALPWPLQWYESCAAYRGTLSTRDPKVQKPIIILYMPRRSDLLTYAEGDQWYRMLHHEVGHAQCGDWH